MRAFFLDRDGVLNRKAPEGGYITNWREIEILPDVLEAALDLSRGGYLFLSSPISEKSQPDKFAQRTRMKFTRK